MKKQFGQLHRPLLKPSVMILLSFALAIAFGTSVLMLPVSHRGTLSGIDALFTATSAVCVTGLTVVDTGRFFTPVGQVIILGLIQVGGLGIITLSALVFYLFTGSISIRDREAVLRMVAGTPYVSLGDFLKTIIAMTVAIEVLGAFFLVIHFRRSYAFGHALFLAIFHAVSAFCNAGFSLFADSLTQDRSDILVNLVVMFLIVVGGLGFPVLLEIGYAVKQRRVTVFHVHTRIVLVTSGVLTVGGALLFFGVEHGNTLKGIPLHIQILASFFQSVTTRTAGFNTIDFSLLANTTLFAVVLLMFIGGGPGSCAGGIKVSSFAVLFATVWNRIRGSSDVNLFGRRIPEATVSRVLSVSTLSFLLVVGVLMLLLMTELGDVSHEASRGTFLELSFEATSAFGTVGLSTGVTAGLSSAGRLLITLLMFAGRVGPLTLTTLLRSKHISGIRLPETDVLVE